MADVAAAVPRLDGRARERFDLMLAWRHEPDPFDEAAGCRELDALLARVTPR